MQIKVIDDASPNGAPTEFIRELAGERVTVHCERGNLGLAGIWNRCIERARGEWVHILHQDDLVFPRFYQSLRPGVEKFPQTGAALCRHAYCNESGLLASAVHFGNVDSHRQPVSFFLQPKILACWRNHSGATTSRQIRTVVETALS